MIFRTIGHGAARLAGAVLLAALCTAMAARPGVAQGSARGFLDFGTGGEHEDYLRAMQLAGIVPMYPWSIRGFSPRELDRLVSADSAGPWRLGRSYSSRGFSRGPLTASVTFNSGFPYGSNDGAVWAGRGLTVAASGGVTFRSGPLSLSIAPIAFMTTNNNFALFDETLTGPLQFNDPSFPALVDRPQRFGDGPYRRLDAGASTLRFDSKYVTFGASTSNQWMGPTTEYPFLLGNNAAGFPHIFLGTGGPIKTWIGSLHGRVLWGRLEQSRYSPVTGSDRYVSPDEPGRNRLATTASFVYLPRGVPGLEIGAARFFHIRYPESGIPGNFWTYALLSGIYQRGEIDRTTGGEVTAENQIASAFFRWAFPGSGFEVFGERGHEDWFYDLRDFIQEPDNYRSYSIGLRKAFRIRTGRVDVLSAETINYQLPTIARDRPQGAVYTHATLRQGHTHRGQLLGADAGVGAAAASVISWTRYTPRGRSTIRWRRTVRSQNGSFHTTGLRDLDATDVIHSLGVERTRRGKSVDITFAIDAMNNFNRNFDEDVANIRLKADLAWRP